MAGVATRKADYSDDEGNRVFSPLCPMFIVNDGGAMDRAWMSIEQKNMKDPFWDAKMSMDIVFAMVIGAQTLTSIPLRTMRLTRVLKEGRAPEQKVYIDDHCKGTWKYHGGNPWKPYPEGCFLSMVVGNEDNTDIDIMDFEHVPGTSTWVRKPRDNNGMKEITYLAPLVLQDVDNLSPIQRTRAAGDVPKGPGSTAAQGLVRTLEGNQEKGDQGAGGRPSKKLKETTLDQEQGPSTSASSTSASSKAPGAPPLRASRGVCGQV